MLLETFATCEPDKVFKDAGFTDMEIDQTIDLPDDYYPVTT